MVSPRHPRHPGVAGLATPRADLRVLPSDRTAPTGGPGRGVRPLTRRYDILWRTADGGIGEASRVAPATPVFEEAFAALGRGALVSTVQGPVAVEDLLPGMEIDTVDEGPQILMWIGAMTLVPGSDEAQGPVGDGARLLRLSADAFGQDRPSPDLVLGPRARLLYRHPRCREILGTSRAFAPARAFADGVSVVEVTPISPVRVFHLGFSGQQAFVANGMEVESQHPGLHAEAMMSPDMLELFLSLFPHVEGLEGFGPMPVPRLTAFELETMRAA
jgi:hypothetical protein